MTILFIGTTELLLITGVALLLFGGKKLPEMMRGMGKGVQEFKKGMNDVTDPESSESHEPSEVSENPEESKSSDSPEKAPADNG